MAELDALRFLAAAAVMLYHFTYGGLADRFPTLGRATMHGYLGVNLFFMISGFVIVWTARDRRPSEFVVSRVARLYPEFWIAVIVSAIAFTIAGARITLPMVAANLTMVPGVFGQEYVDGVYWTLLVELKFYALLWALSLVRQMPRVESWIYVWLAATVATFLFDVPWIARSLTIYPFSPLFIAGCLFFLIRADGLTITRAIGTLVCLLLAVSHAGDGMRGFVQSAHITQQTILESRLIIIGCFSLLAFISVYRRPVSVPFASTIALLGLTTYPLYLLHNVGKVLILKPMAPYHPSLALLCAIAVSMGLAVLLALLVERHWRKPFARHCTRWLVRSPAEGREHRAASLPVDASGIGRV